MPYLTFRFLCFIALSLLISCKKPEPQGYAAQDDDCHTKAAHHVGVYFSGESAAASDQDKNVPELQLYCDCMTRRGWNVSACPKSDIETKTVAPAPVAPVTETNAAATAAVPATSAVRAVTPNTLPSAPALPPTMSTVLPSPAIPTPIPMPAQPPLLPPTNANR